MPNKQVIIPFKPEWEEKMLSGIKTCTSRTRKYGNPGDIFKKFDATFIILSVTKYPLENVARFLYGKEGFDTPEEFIKMWTMLHKRKGWVSTQIVFTHFFRRE